MIFRIKVIPKSSQDRVVEHEGDMLKVKCRAVPEKGRANEAVVAILAKYFKVSKRDVTILRGHTSSIKTIEIKAD